MASSAEHSAGRGTRKMDNASYQSLSSCATGKGELFVKLSELLTVEIALKLAIYFGFSRAKSDEIEHAKHPARKCVSNLVEGGYISVNDISPLVQALERLNLLGVKNDVESLLELHTSEIAATPEKKTTFALKATVDVDERGKIIQLNQVGVKLDIPEKAVSKKTRVSIKVNACADSGNLTAVTSVAPSISFEPSALNFEKPATLVVPHCAVIQGEEDVENNEAEATSEPHLRVKEHTYELPLMCLSKVVSFTGGFHQKKEGFILFRKGMDVEVWLCNDLESEYLNLIRQQRGRGFQSCEAQGSFVFDLNSHYVLKANVKVVAKCMRTRTKTEQDLDTWKLFGAKPFCVSYALQPIDQTLGPRYTLMFEIYRDDDKTPLTKTKIKIESQERDSEVLSSGSMESEEEIDSDSDYNSEDDSDSDTESESDRNPLLDKEGEDNHASVTIEELISYCLESIDELLNFSIKEAKRCPIVHESVISFMKEVAEDLEKKRFNTDRKIIGGSFLGAVGGGLTVASIATAPITAGVSTGLLVPGIILSVGGGACNIHSVVHKHRFDKKKKQKIEEDLTAFVQFQSELLKSIVILFKSRQTVLAIRNNLSNKLKKAKCMNKKDFEAAVARYKENAQHTCNDFFEVVHHVFSQSKDVESIVNKIKSSQENLPGGIKFAVQRTPFSMKNVFVVLPFVMKYQAKRNTYLQFCKKVLNPESATKKELPSALFIGADAGKSLLGAGTGIGARVCNGIEDATKILKIARGIAIVGYLLGGLGIALDIGTMVFAIADLLKKDKQKLTKAVLECIEMVEDINDICLSI